MDPDPMIPAGRTGDRHISPIFLPRPDPHALLAIPRVLIIDFPQEIFGMDHDPFLLASSAIDPPSSFEIRRIRIEGPRRLEELSQFYSKHNRSGAIISHDPFLKKSILN